MKDNLKHIIKLLIRLIDGIEYMDSGLCNLNYKLFIDEFGSARYYDSKIYLNTVDFLGNDLPYPKFPDRYGGNTFSWPSGDHDRRFYWLKNQLRQYKNLLDIMKGKYLITTV